MLNIELYSVQNTLLYASEHVSVRDAVEAALASGVCLDGVNLEHQDLQNITLDGYAIRHGSFKGANLSGANMSEGDFRDADFSEALLFNTCFCYSDLTGSRFINTQFGGTDIAEAVLDDCRLGDPSALSLNFRAAKSHRGATYYFDTHTILDMSHTPIVIHGFDQPIAVFDDAVAMRRGVYPLKSLAARVDFSTWRIIAKNLRPYSLADTLHRNTRFQSKIK